MKRDLDQPITIRPANENSPRLAAIVARADQMAAELAALAATPTQAAIVASIARAALARAFGAVR